MAIARSAQDTFDYVAVGDREQPEDKRTTWHLRRLTTRTMVRLNDLAGNGQKLDLALLGGIAGWSNLRDETGALVAARTRKGLFTFHGIELRDPLDESSLNRIPTELTAEIGLAVLSGNKLTPEDLGN